MEGEKLEKNNDFFNKKLKKSWEKKRKRKKSAKMR